MIYLRSLRLSSRLPKMCAEQKKISNKQASLMIEPMELIKELETRLREIKSEDLPEIQPLRHFMELKQEGDKPSNYFITMPAYVPSIKCFGVKLLTLFPGNADTEHPVHSSMVRLYGSERGQLLAELDGDPITSERTAAVSAIAANLLSPGDSSLVLAVIGSGVQAKSHIKYFTCIREFKEIRVWSRSPKNIQSCIESVHQPHKVKASKTAEEACANADVILTATLSRAPVVQGRWLKEGALVVSVGACRADWRELDDQVMHNAAIYVDNVESAKAESGDIVLSGTTGEILGDIGWMLREDRKANNWRGGKKFLLFKSLGMAIEDVVTAHLEYSKKSSK